MSLRLRRTMTTVLSRDVQEENKTYSRNESGTDDITYDLNLASPDQYQIVIGATQTVNFGGISSAKFLAIESDQDVIVSINGASPGFHVTPNQDGTVSPQTTPPTMITGILFLNTSGLTSLTVQNPNTNTAVANVTLCLGG